MTGENIVLSLASPFWLQVHVREHVLVGVCLYLVQRPSCFSMLVGFCNRVQILWCVGVITQCMTFSC